jgi:hypothetical protein
MGLNKLLNELYNKGRHDGKRISLLYNVNNFNKIRNWEFYRDEVELYYYGSRGGEEESTKNPGKSREGKA